MNMLYFVKLLIYSYVAFATRCPRGIKTVLYKKAKLEKFAEYLNQNGMTSRLTIYSDMSCKIYMHINVAMYIL